MGDGEEKGGDVHRWWCGTEAVVRFCPLSLQVDG